MPLLTSSTRSPSLIRPRDAAAPWASSACTYRNRTLDCTPPSSRNPAGFDVQMHCVPVSVRMSVCVCVCVSVCVCVCVCTHCSWSEPLFQLTKAAIPLVQREGKGPALLFPCVLPAKHNVIGSLVSVCNCAKPTTRVCVCASSTRNCSLGLAFMCHDHSRRRC